jgi:hypothetical protein
VAITRLVCHGRNLLRALMTNAVQAGLDPTQLDDRASADNVSADSGGNFFANLDSELFRVPVGLACFFLDKVHHHLGAFYLELCQIQSWALGFGAGQSMILENVNLLFDRLYPIDATQLALTANAQEPMSAILTTSALGIADSPSDTGLPPESSR